MLEIWGTDLENQMGCETWCTNRINAVGLSAKKKLWWPWERKHQVFGWYRRTHQSEFSIICKYCTNYWVSGIHSDKIQAGELIKSIKNMCYNALLETWRRALRNEPAEHGEHRRHDTGFWLMSGIQWLNYCPSRALWKRGSISLRFRTRTLGTCSSIIWNCRDIFNSFSWCARLHSSLEKEWLALATSCFATTCMYLGQAHA